MLSHNPIAPQKLAQNLPINPPDDEKDLHNQGNAQDSSIDDISEARKDRFFGLEKPKTANRAFGSVSDFLLFFENRNKEIKEFAKKLTELEQLQEPLSLERLFDEIQPVLRDCLAKEWQKKLNHDDKNEYSKFFAEKFESWDEFYGKILHAYTISGFLYKNMNQYLRDENWMELTDLLPYIFCLLKALLQKSIMTKSFASLKKRAKNDKLVLYRGAKFESKVMDFYNPQKTKNFSWHAVTSTSTKDRAALRFSEKANENQTAVLFIIEVDLNILDEKQLNFLDIRDYSQFRAEDEIILAPGSIFELAAVNKTASMMYIKLKLVTNTVKLAYQGQFMHGTLQAAMRERNDLKIVSLKKKELSRAIKHCAGNEMIEDLEFSLCKFNKKSAENLVRVLETMKGLKNFTFSSVILKEKGDLERILRCLGQKKIEQLEILATLSKDKHVISLAESLEYLSSLKVLKISLEEGCVIEGDIVKLLYERVFESLSSDCIFELSTVNDLKIATKGVRNHLSLGRSLEERWPVSQKGNEVEVQENQLEGYFPRKQFESEKENSLKVIGNPRVLMYFCEQNKRIRRRTFRETLEGLDSPSNISIKFDDSSNISDSEIKSFAKEGLQKLQSLKTLCLFFENCENITDQGIEDLCREGIQYLGSLISLSVSFIGDKKLTEAAIENLCAEGILYMEELASLTLSFEKWGNINSNDAMATLAIGGLEPRCLTLRYLSLNFSSCNWMTDQDIEILCSEGIQHLEILETLKLEFSKSWKITDLGVEKLCHLGIKHLKCLKNLKLNFEACMKITNNAIKSLCFEGLQHVKSLKSLHLMFGMCEKITNEGIKILHKDGLAYLENLEMLNLDFNRGPQVNDESLKFLCCHGVRDLKKLRSLALNFKASNIGLKSVCEEGISFPETLRNLHIGFDGYHGMNVEYLNMLKEKILKGKLPCLSLPLEVQENRIVSQPLQEPGSAESVSIMCQASTGLFLQGKRQEKSVNMSELLERNAEFAKSESLCLGFEDCDAIRNDIFKYICFPQAFEESLRSLHVDFAKCRPIREKGVASLCSEILRKLPLLNCLILNFDWCEQVSSFELKDLCQEGIQYLTVLKSLQLSFNFCMQIDDAGLKYLGLLPNLGSLETLNLSFNRCFSISNLGLKALFASGNIQSLTKLSLSFDCCAQITNEGIEHLSNLQINQLSDLSLSFHQCWQITDKGLKTFVSKWVKNLKDLKSLHLNFNCIQVTDQGFEIFCCEGLQSLESLTNLSLSFDYCRFVTDAGLEILAQKGLRYLEPTLTELQLSFSGCQEITNKGVESLWSEGIGKRFLSSLFLNFSRTSVSEEFVNKDSSRLGKYVVIESNRISRQLQNPILKRYGKEEKKSVYNPVKILSKSSYAYHLPEKYQDPKQAILDLLSQKAALKTLSLGFNDAAYSDNDLNKLSCQGIAYLTSLTTLHIGFHSCLAITENGFNTLFTQGIRKLTSITSLSLRFIFCKGITDKAIRDLCCQAIQNLPLLSNLHLNFDGCEGVNDVSLQILSKEGLRCCKSLTSLYLSFNGPNNISDVGFKSLCSEGLRHVKLLSKLQLNFSDCGGISDVALKSLSEDGLQGLILLTELYLWFDRGREITEIGFHSLIREGIKCLKLLQRLELSFQWHTGLADNELELLGK